jgi:hypothetical protein
MNLSQLKFSVTFLLILFFCGHSSAQKLTLDYDLNEYKLPYLKRHLLEFDFSIANTHSVTKYTYNDLDPDKSVTRNFSSNLNPEYTFYLNSNKYQINQMISGNLPGISFQKYSSDGSGYNNSQLDLNPSVVYSGEFREYIAGRLFLEQDVIFQFSYERDLNKSEQINDLDEVTYKETFDMNSQNLSVSIPVLVGWGRVERVEDARLAVYILDDLQKAGQLSREVNSRDISLLAKRISEIQNERFFDSRHKKIWELEQIDSILHDIGLVEADNIYYFTLLNDNWDYANGPLRESGFRVSGGLCPELMYNMGNTHYEQNYPDLDSINTTDSETKDRQIGGGSLIRLDYEKPLNLYWQFSLGNEFRVSQLFEKSEYLDAPETKYRNLSLDNQFFIAFGFYPNSRTSMSLSMSEAYIYQKIAEENQEDIITHTIRSSIWFSFNYYVSPQIRLYLHSGIYSNYSKTDDSINQSIGANFDYSMNVSLVYKLL